MVLPLPPVLMVFGSKGQPYVTLVMGCSQLFVELTVGLPEDIVDQRRGSWAL